MNDNITGRDGMIIAEALARAYAFEWYLPEPHRAPSNRDDRLELLYVLFPTAAARYHAQALISAHCAFRDFPRLIKFDPRSLRDQLQAELVAMEAMEPNDTARRRDLTVMIRQLDEYRTQSPDKPAD
jgi:hypothetical protein